MSKRLCSECGKPGGGKLSPLLRKRDAADATHYFHAPCWKRFLAWLGR